MQVAVKMTFLILIFTVSWLLQEQNQEWDRSRQLLKGANNFAVHDAANKFTERDEHGKLVVERDQEAYEYYRSTLQDNLGLDDSMNPRVGSPLIDKVLVIEFEIIDERTVTFPFWFVNENYGIRRRLQGPAVFAVIETLHPQLMIGSHEPPIRVSAIHEYVEGGTNE